MMDDRKQDIECSRSRQVQGQRPPLVRWGIILFPDPWPRYLHNHPFESSILTMTSHPVGGYTVGKGAQAGSLAGGQRA